MPPFSPSAVFTEWGLPPVLFVLVVWATGLYLVGVWRLHERGDRWPLGRTLAFVVGGMGSFFFATSSGVAAYDTTLLSVHMVQHMILSMVVPLFCALGAPVTLALRTLPRRPRAWLLAVLHSRVAKVLTFAPLTFALYVVSPWALYFSGWYDATLQSAFLHELMHVHLVVVGALFFTPILGVDPVPGRVSYPFRLLLLMLTLPFHAFLGVTIMGQSELIGGDWYPSLHGSMPWLPDPLDDQHLAGRDPLGLGRPDRRAAVQRAVRAVGAVLDAGGQARGPAAGPAGADRAGDGAVRRAPGGHPGRRGAQAVASAA